MNELTCCFLGHRKIDQTKELEQQLYKQIENLITNKHVNCFLFGSKSAFIDLCYCTTTKLKDKYPHIKRIYVRAEFPHISDDYKAYLLQNYEDTYFPSKAMGAGKTVYIKRNQEMIDKSRFCIIYYHHDSFPTNRKSGTQIALDYAIKQKKKIILMP
jgi:uncharacterized phage-like protein YoqJ